MNEEEIQIIDFAYLKMCAEHDYIYETGEAKLLLNYITNLQQENARLKDKNDKIEKWLKYKAEALDTFDIPKRKETGAFWFTTRGEIDGLLELLKEN